MSVMVFAGMPADNEKNTVDDSTIYKVMAGVIVFLTTAVQTWFWHMIKKNDEDQKSQWDHIDRRATKEDLAAVEHRQEVAVSNMRTDIQNAKTDVIKHIDHMVDILRK